MFFLNVLTISPSVDSQMFNTAVYEFCVIPLNATASGSLFVPPFDETKRELCYSMLNYSYQNYNVSISYRDCFGFTKSVCLNTSIYELRC